VKLAQISASFHLFHPLIQTRSERSESDGVKTVNLKPKRRFSACQKIRQPKRKDLGIY